MADIPELEETGSTGDQKAVAGEVLPPQPDIPIRFGPMTEAVEGLASSNARAIGGQVPAAMISAFMRQQEMDLQDTKADLRSVRESLDQARSNLAKCRTHEAVLQHQVSSAATDRHLRNLGIAIGSVLLGLAVNVDPGSLLLSIIMGFAGAVLMLAGWFLPASGRQK